VSAWRSAKALRVLAALLRIGWSIKREAGGSHKVLERAGSADFVWAFHDRDEIRTPHARPHREANGARAGGSLRF
jgi:hypothetical protein